MPAHKARVRKQRLRSIEAMYSNQLLQRYVDDLASSMSMPAGGSASAFSGVMGAALVSMVARLTLGKSGYEGVQQEIEELLQQSEHLRARFQYLMQADIEAYEQFSACYKLPRNTDEERMARDQAIQTQLVEATLVPLHMVEGAATLLKLCQRVAQVGNARILSDLGVGATQAACAGTAAAWIVRANLHIMKDTELVYTLNNRLNKALDIITESSTQIPDIIGERA